MSAASHSRCIFCKLLPAPVRSTRGANRRAFHGTPTTQGRRKTAFASIRAVDLGLIAQRPQHEETSNKMVTAKALTQLRGKGVEHRPRRIRAAPVPPPRHSHDEEAKWKESYFQPYTAEENRLLALKYTPEQMEALRAGEAAIKPKDLAEQGRMRDDAWRMDYEDDFSKILPWIDHPVRAPDEDIDPDIRPLTEEETHHKFAAFYEDMLQKQDDQLEETEDGIGFKDSMVGQIKDSMLLGVHPYDGLTPEQRVERLRKYAEKYEAIDVGVALSRFCADPANFFYSPKGTLHSQQDVTAAALPKLKDPRAVMIKEGEDPAVERLALATGRDLEEIEELSVRALVSHRVVNQTRMGKMSSMYILSVAGDGFGMLGIGEGKGAEFEDAQRQSRLAAIRNMKPVPRYEQRTIYGDSEAKVGASIVKLSSRPPGFGNRCQFLIFELARAAGIRDLSARCLRSRNKMNVVKAAYAALMSQRIPEEVARARGRKMVDVRHVYYSGRQAVVDEDLDEDKRSLEEMQGKDSDEERELEQVQRLLGAQTRVGVPDEDELEPEEEVEDWLEPEEVEDGLEPEEVAEDFTEDITLEPEEAVERILESEQLVEGGTLEPEEVEEDDGTFVYKNWDEFVEEPDVDMENLTPGEGQGESRP